MRLALSWICWVRLLLRWKAVTMLMYVVSSPGGLMPRKRAIEVRLAEMEDKMERLKLEKAIRDMRDRVRSRTPRRRKRR